MKRASRRRDPRYVEVTRRGSRTYVRDEAVLFDEIISLLDMRGELSCNRISVLIGAANTLVDRALGTLMDEGRVTRIKRSGGKGHPHYLWLTGRSASGIQIRFNGASILGAFQRMAADRS